MSQKSSVNALTAAGYYSTGLVDGEDVMENDEGDVVVVDTDGTQRPHDDQFSGRRVTIRIKKMKRRLTRQAERIAALEATVAALQASGPTPRGA